MTKTNKTTQNTDKEMLAMTKTVLRLTDTLSEAYDLASQVYYEKEMIRIVDEDTDWMEERAGRLLEQISALAEAKGLRKVDAAEMMKNVFASYPETRTYYRGVIAAYKGFEDAYVDELLAA
jgi:hypothetical protein